MPSSAKPLLTLIDGRSGAGKSEYARGLALSTGAILVSLDDVYPGWDGLDAGSWHIAQSVIIPMSAGQPGRYRRWNWDVTTPGEWVEIGPGQPLVIEGCGVLRSDISDVGAVRLWLEAPEGVRRQRAIERDGDVYRPHWARWALQEERFIALHGGRARAEKTVVTG